MFEKKLLLMVESKATGYFSKLKIRPRNLGPTRQICPLLEFFLSSIAQKSFLNILYALAHFAPVLPSRVAVQACLIS